MKEKLVDGIEVEYHDEKTEGSELIQRILEKEKYITSGLKATIAISKNTSDRYAISTYSLSNPSYQVINKKDCLDLSKLFALLADDLP